MKYQSKHLILMLMITCILISFYKGYHASSMWSTNYYQLSYLDGFVKRAFIGTILYPLGCLRFNYYFIEAIQFIILFTDIALLTYFCIKYKLEPIAIIFFASAAGWFLVNTVGYIEQILWLITFLALLALEKNRQLIASCLLLISALIHETGFFITIPIAFGYMIIRNNKLSSYIKMFAPAILATTIIFILFEVSPDSVLLSYPNTIASCGYSNPSLENYLFIYRPVLKNEELSLNYKSRHLPMLFAILCISYLLRKLYQTELSLPKTKGWLLILCCLAPLILGFYGFDADRWIFETFAQILIISVLVLTHARNTNGSIKKLTVFYCLIAIIAISLNFKYFHEIPPRELTIEKISTFADFVKQQLVRIPET